MIPMIHIEVTIDDILQGLPNNEQRCPIALACGRKFNTDDVSVTIDTIIIDDNIYRTPDIAQDFINAFDEGEPRLPINFTIEPSRL